MKYWFGFRKLSANDSDIVNLMELRVVLATQFKGARFGAMSVDEVVKSIDRIVDDLR